MTKPVCLITGVGPGTGSALARKFSEKYQVAMIARDESRLRLLEEELENAHGFPCDITDTEALTSTLASIIETLGNPAVVIHNAVGGAFGDVLTVKPKHLQLNFQINTMALLHIIQSLAPSMVEAGKGVILATGNTSAYRGSANFAGFAPSKAAQRILMEASARSLGPKGIHVSYVAIDAVIDVPWARDLYSDKPDDFFCQPTDIAAECFHIAHQPKSAWTFDVMIRPFAENW